MPCYCIAGPRALLGVPQSIEQLLGGPQAAGNLNNATVCTGKIPNKPIETPDMHDCGKNYRTAG